MTKPIRHILALLALTTLLLAAAGCSGQNAECKVTFDGEETLNIIVNPPGESGTAQMDGSLERNARVSPGKVVATYDGQVVKTYDASGARYTIQVHIETAGDRLTAYTLEVTGGVYGSTPHTCTK